MTGDYNMWCIRGRRNSSTASVPRTKSMHNTLEVCLHMHTSWIFIFKDLFKSQVSVLRIVPAVTEEESLFILSFIFHLYEGKAALFLRPCPEYFFIYIYFCKNSKLVIEIYQLWKQFCLSRQCFFCTTINTTTEGGLFQRATSIRGRHHLCHKVSMEAGENILQ